MNIFVLTGAGISAESGLGTFRDKAGTGIWARFDPMTLATPEAFARDPAQVHAFYNMRRRNLIGAEPNPVHLALVRLEAGLAESGGNLFLCTQNIDDLHEHAGSQRVVHMQCQESDPVALGDEVLNRDMQVGEHGLERLNVLFHPFRPEPRACRVVEKVVCDLLIDSSRIEAVHGRLIVRPDQRLIPLDFVRHRRPTPEKLIQQGYAEQKASARDVRALSDPQVFVQRYEEAKRTLSAALVPLLAR